MSGSNNIATLSATLGSSPVWKNWSGSLSYHQEGENYYFMPKTTYDLQAVLAFARTENKKVRVSGQRHSQSPLVVDAPAASNTNLLLIDLSCYASLGDGSQQLEINASAATVTLNAGVREDELDAFLTRHNFMLKTVTAGGFFSVGGMTAVDVHGASVGEPIFAETASAFQIMGPDGVETLIDANSPLLADGWSPLQFARVSLGALGVVTAITIDILPRPHANNLMGGVQESNWNSEKEFVKGMKELLASKSRLEIFFNPYADRWITSPFIIGWWSQADGSLDNSPSEQSNTCQLANADEYGAPYLSSLLEPGAEWSAQEAQEASDPLFASLVCGAAGQVIKQQMREANQDYSDLWLTEAARASFMSYFIELPDLDAAGLGMLWNALNSVKNKTKASNEFHIAAPMEFRFVLGGNSAMAGTYTKNAGAHFINLDLIAFVAENTSKTGLVYNAKMLQFFADIEREWVALGGMPHNGKMYGFYDPAIPGSYSLPYNPAFVSSLAAKREARVKAFNAYRTERDPDNMFCNEYVAALL